MTGGTAFFDGQMSVNFGATLDPYALDNNNRPYILLKGDKDTRFKTAIVAIDAIMKNRNNLYSYSDSLKDE